MTWITTALPMFSACRYLLNLVIQDIAQIAERRTHRHSDMRLLLDHTLVHRVGRVLDSRDASAIRSVDALAIFHMAEHILFADEVIVSSFEPNPTLDRTAGILTKLAKLGVASDGRTTPSLLRLEPFNEEEHLAACKEAGPGVLDELVGLSGRQLGAVGRLADDAARPEAIAPPALDTWLADSQFLDAPPDRIAHLASLQAPGSFELTVVLYPSLFEWLKGSQSKSARTRKIHAAAVGALIRVHINQEIATLRSAKYAPSPQRTRISHMIDGLFRHMLEHRIQEEVQRLGHRKLRGALSLLSGPDFLPLPLFVFHALRGKALGSPIAVLEAARAMREDPETVRIRKWLAQLEDQSSSLENNDRSVVLQELNSLADDVASPRQDTLGMVARLLTPPLATKPEGGMEIGLSAPLAGLLEMICRRDRRQRRFLAVVADGLATDKKLGGRILKQLGRWPKD